MAKIFALAAFTLIAVANAGAVAEVSDGVTWSICSLAPNILNVQNVEVTPNPPKKNQTISAKFTVDSRISETLNGLNVAVLYNGVKIYSTVEPETADCPANQTTTFSFSTFLPSIAPSGSYTIQVEPINTSKAPVSCVNVNFPL